MIALVSLYQYYLSSEACNAYRELDNKVLCMHCRPMMKVDFVNKGLGIMPLHFYPGVLLIIWDVEKGFNYFSLGTRFHHFSNF